MKSGIPEKRHRSRVCPKTRKVPPDKRRISYYLPEDVIRAVNDEAMEEGREKTSGRVHNPSAVVERILRAHFAAKPKRRAK